MILRNYELGDKLLKITCDAMLLKTDRCIITLTKHSLALPIKANRRIQGYVFHGNGKLLVDTIIETPRGAVGTPTKEDLTQPFIMLGGTENLKDSFEEASLADLSNMNYENAEAFKKKADGMCRRFFSKHFCRVRFREEEKACVFAFLKENENFDMLISKNDRLLYKSGGEVYIFKGDRGLLTRYDEIVVSKPGKYVIVCCGNVFLDMERDI